MKPYTELLRCELTDSEMADAARELARSNQRCASIEQQKKEVDSQLKAEIEAEKTKIARISSLINTGSEYRNIECRVDLDLPDPGKKTTYRLDTGEEVSVKNMTDADRQMALDLREKADAEDAAKHPEPIVTPPPVLLTIEAPVVENGATVAPAAVMGGTHQRKRKDTGKEAAAGE